MLKNDIFIRYLKYLLNNIYINIYFKYLWYSSKNVYLNDKKTQIYKNVIFSLLHKILMTNQENCLFYNVCQNDKI